MEPVHNFTNEVIIDDENKLKCISSSQSLEFV